MVCLRKSIGLAALVVMLSFQSVRAEVIRTLFIETPDGAISAYFEGSMCAERVKMLFEGSSPDAFAEASTPASRLMNNAVTVLKIQCPVLARVTSRGIVDGRVVYSGIAESASGWKLTQLGMRSNASILGGATGIADGQQAQFRDSGSFQGFAGMAGRLNGKIFCVRPESGTCGGGSRYTDAGPAGAKVTARYLLDEDGAVAEMSYDAVENGGFLCAETAKIDLNVTGGTMTEEGRAEYTVMLEERLMSSGDSICTGFEQDGGQLLMSNFDGEGRPIGTRSPFVEATAPVRLRLDE